jgi:GxxExxY protein
MIEAGLSERVIGAAISVHRELGPGLLESIYEACLCREFDLLGIAYERQVALPVSYKGVQLECGHRMDLVVEGRLVLELKSVEELLPLHEAQLLTYLKLSGIKIGLLININVPVLKDGVRRRVH